MLLVESYNNPDAGKTVNHARLLEAFCARNHIRLSLANRSPGTSKLTIGVPTPLTSPLFTGSFPASPLVYSPQSCSRPANHIDLVPPLSLDGHQTGKSSLSPPTSPSLLRQPSILVRSLHEKLQNLPQVGVIHLALQNDSTGSILRSSLFLLFFSLSPLQRRFHNMHLVTHHTHLVLQCHFA